MVLRAKPHDTNTESAPQSTINDEETISATFFDEPVQEMVYVLFGDGIDETWIEPEDEIPKGTVSREEVIALEEAMEVEDVKRVFRGTSLRIGNVFYLPTKQPLSKNQNHQTGIGTTS